MEAFFSLFVTFCDGGFCRAPQLFVLSSACMQGLVHSPRSGYNTNSSPDLSGPLRCWRYHPRTPNFIPKEDFFTYNNGSGNISHACISSSTGEIASLEPTQSLFFHN